MIVTCVYVKVRAEVIKDFVEATTQNHFESIKEPGNLRFDFIQQADDPSRFMIYEAYENEDAATKHKMTSHYFRWKDTVMDFMAEPRNGVKYNIIEPSDRTKW